MVRAIFVTSTLLMGLLAGGCAPKIWPATPHAALTPPEVKLYRKAPAEYEVLGMVESTESLTWGENADITHIINPLRAKAAALGANGLLLQHPDGVRRVMMATGKYDDEDDDYSVPIRLKPGPHAAVATAIWVKRAD